MEGNGLTLEEAIEHCYEKAQCGTACGNDHLQLARWLEELKGLREENKKLREVNRLLQKDLGMFL